MATLKGRAKGYPRATFDWDGRRVVRTYEDRWIIEAATETELPNAIITALGIPVGDQFPDDLSARCKRVGPMERSAVNRLHWEVPLFYTNQFPQLDADDADKPPDERRLRRRWSFETMQEAMTKDAINSDVAIENSVEEPIEVTHDIVIPVLTVERWESDFVAQTILDYVNYVNASAFYGAPAKTALMAGIEAEEDEAWEGDIYWRVRYVIKFKVPVTESNKGWYLRLIDIGTMHRDPDNTTLFVPNVTDADGDGNVAQVMKRLDGSGNLLEDGDPPFVLPDDTGFNEFKTANFDALAIGPNN